MSTMREVALNVSQPWWSQVCLKWGSFGKHHSQQPFLNETRAATQNDSRFEASSTIKIPLWTMLLEKGTAESGWNKVQYDITVTS